MVDAVRGDCGFQSRLVVKCQTVVTIGTFWDLVANHWERREERKREARGEEGGKKREERKEGRGEQRGERTEERGGETAKNREGRG